MSSRDCCFHRGNRSGLRQNYFFDRAVSWYLDRTGSTVIDFHCVFFPRCRSLFSRLACRHPFCPRSVNHANTGAQEGAPALLISGTNQIGSLFAGHGTVLRFCVVLCFAFMWLSHRKTQQQWIDVCNGVLTIPDDIQTKSVLDRLFTVGMVRT